MHMFMLHVHVMYVVVVCACSHSCTICSEALLSPRRSVTPTILSRSLFYQHPHVTHTPLRIRSDTCPHRAGLPPLLRPDLLPVPHKASKQTLLNWHPSNAVLEFAKNLAACAASPVYVKESWLYVIQPAWKSSVWPNASKTSLQPRPAHSQ